MADTPSDTEAIGVTYQRHGWDAGLFNIRVGTLWKDNGSYHNQLAVDPYNVTNMFVNYTIRKGSLFDQTKMKLSFNNIFNQHNITSVSGLGSISAAPAIAANGTSYMDQVRSELLPTITAIQATGASSLRAIAAELNAREIPTPRRIGEWSAVQVQRAMERWTLG